MAKKIWGPATWRLFHIIGEKIETNNYTDIQNAVSIVQMICGNLPCPDCSRDATFILSKYNLKKITTKEELKLFLYTFHNIVNKKLNKPILEKEELDIMYKEMNFNQVLNNFFYIYNNIHGYKNMMLYSFHRKNLIINIKNYFLQNLHLFNRL
jgi:hypothetical protein